MFKLFWSMHTFAYDLQFSEEETEPIHCNYIELRDSKGAKTVIHFHQCLHSFSSPLNTPIQLKPHVNPVPAMQAKFKTKNAAGCHQCLPCRDVYFVVALRVSSQECLHYLWCTTWLT